MPHRRQWVLVAALLLAAGLLHPESRSTAFEAGGSMAVELSSTAFTSEGTIPKRHTCDGENVSPPLAWGGIPPEAISLALVVDDPDAPGRTWVHWLAYDLPAASGGLPESVPPEKAVAGGGRQGRNDFGRLGYGGPCPPSGTHRYHFRLYALDTVLGLDAGASKAELLQAMQGHVLAEATLIGRYRR